MANLILGNGEFGQALKFEARDSGHQLSHGPVYGSAGYVALRNNDYFLDQTVYVMTSVDGVTWTEQTHNINLTSEQVRGLEYLNGQYIVYGIEQVGASYYLRINTSSDGITWSSYTSASSMLGMDNPTAITYANGLWQVFGSTNTADLISFTSSNLVNWTQRLTFNFPNGATYTFTNAAFTDVVTDGTTTVAVAWGTSITDSTGNYLGTETVIARSTNGTTWTADSIDGGFTSGGDGWKINSIAYGNSTWVIVGDTGKIYTSTDADNWTIRTSGTTGNIFSVAFANGAFIAQRYTSGNTQATVEILKSTNGTTWTSVTPQVIESDDVLYASNGADPSLYNTKPVYALSKWIVSDYQSVDNGGSWTILDYQVPNKQPFIKYDYEAGWNTWKTMDFWAFIPQHPQEFTGMAIASERGSWTVYLETQANGTLAIKYRGYGLTFADTFIHSSFVFGEWNHFRLVVDNGNASWYLNGTRQSITNTGNRLVGNDTLNIGYSAWIAESQYSRPVDYYIDEFMLTDEALNPTSATNITVPTAPFINTEATSILLHFDTDFNDDPSDPARSAEASIASAFGEDVSINVVYNVQAGLNANLVQASSVNVVRAGTADLSTSFVLLTSALDLDLASANITVVSSLEANAGIIKQADALIDSTSEVSIVNGRLIRASGSLEVNAFELVAVARTQQFGAYIEAVSSLTANPIKAADAPTEINATSALTANISKQMETTAEFSLTTNLVANTDKVISFISTESTVSEMTVVVKKFAGTSVNINCTTTLELTTSNTQVTSGALFNQCSMNITAQAVKRIELDLPIASNLLAITNNVVRAEADLTVTAFELTIAKAFNLDESVVWIVPAENKLWTIPKDNNDYLITLENREYKI